MRAAPNSSPWRALWRRPSVRFSLAVLAVYSAAALVGEIAYRATLDRGEAAPWHATDLDAANTPPFGGDGFHPMGTDSLGRDVLLRLVQGARISFQVGVVTSLIALPLGVALGCLGGYFGGRIDDVIVWLISTFASIPGLLFILAIAMAAGQGLAGIYLGIGLTTWVGVCRLIRGEVMRQRDLAYVDAARVLGYSSFRILFRHILPNVAHLVIVVFTLRFPAAVSTEVFMSFLGIGVENEPSWGVMLSSARLRLWQGAWWEMTFVTLAVFFVVLSFHLLGDALRDVLDPRAGPRVRTG